MKVFQSNLQMLVLWTIVIGPLAPMRTQSALVADMPIGALPDAQTADESRADEWKRREIMKLQHGQSLLDANAVSYLEVIVVPLVVFILAIGVVRRNDL